MFDILPNTLTLILTQAYPIYAAHKVLLASRNALNPTTTETLKPHLTTLLSLLSLSTLESLPPIPLITWFVPLYAYLRLGVGLYLVLPLPGYGVNGATLAYDRYISPFLINHERDIERSIQNAKSKVQKFPGLSRIDDIIDFVRVRLLGWAPARRAPADAGASKSDHEGYVGQMLEMLGISPASPARRQAGIDGAEAVNPMAAQAATALTGAATSLFNRLAAPNAAQVRAGPTGVFEKSRLAYLESEKSRLTEALAANGKEAELIKETSGLAYCASGASSGSELHAPGGAASKSEKVNMGRSRSEAEFEVLREEDVGPGGVGVENAGGKSVEDRAKKGWGSWVWGTKSGGDEHKKK